MNLSFISSVVSSEMLIQAASIIDAVISTAVEARHLNDDKEKEKLGEIIVCHKRFNVNHNFMSHGKISVLISTSLLGFIDAASAIIENKGRSARH